MVTISDDHLDRTFAALAHPIRRSILTRLAREGSASVSELAEPFDVSLMAVSKHLKVMDEAGLIRREKDGRVQRCSFDPEAMDGARSWIEKHEEFWKRQLDSLATYLEAPDRDRPPAGGDDGGGRLHDEEERST
ncbi:MAG: metalloregulator ArsR/SmtB family transcription factor [Longimicrobiales bacterium]|nr:metalloregulator ArsR/SmtB family transcription factor [Longimicrobiales bacterium]